MSEREKELPEIVSSETAFRGKVFDVVTDTVRENGREHRRDVVRHKGSGVIVPVFDDKTIALVRQYRHPAQKFLLEVPAGSVDAEESPETCAARELTEELGLVAGKLERLAEFYVSPGFLTEKMYVYLATDLTETEAKPEDDEFIERVRVTFPKALEMIASGEICDAKTIIGVLLAAPRFGFAPLYA